jgi:hypothetical protein
LYIAGDAQLQRTRLSLVHAQSLWETAPPPAKLGGPNAN